MKTGPNLSHQQLAWLVSQLEAWPQRLPYPCNSCPSCNEPATLICGHCGTLFDGSDEARQELIKQVESARKAEDIQRIHCDTLGDMLRILQEEFDDARAEIAATRTRNAAVELFMPAEQGATITRITYADPVLKKRIEDLQDALAACALEPWWRRLWRNPLG